MRFGPLLLDGAEGAILAHSLRLPSGTLRKGHLLTAEDIENLRAAGLAEVVAARLEDGDVAENEAAERVARAAAGPGSRIAAPFTGRCNIHASARGVAVIERERVDRLNLIDEALTIATLPPFELVDEGQLLATVKVNPLAAPSAVVEAAVRVASTGAGAGGEGPLLRVAPLAEHAAGLVLTRLPGLKERVLDKTVATVRARLEALGSRLAAEVRCAHHEASVAEALQGLLGRGLAPILIFGASAIIDRRDVVPAAIARAGGRVEHFGMPVDPGNLLLLARCGETPVLGLPGSARSPRMSGFDWVLQRLLAGLEVSGRDLMRLGAGGLLKEMPGRPQPRERPRAEAPPEVEAVPLVAALVLAAGQSRRMGGRNKLLAEIEGRPMVARVVDAVLASPARPVIVVTGHQEAKLRDTLEGREVRFVHNPDYAEGLSTSLKRGVAALGPEVDGVLVCLGDMPRVAPVHLERLIAAFGPAEGRAICVPTRDGKRGNPVLWGAEFFDEMKELAGDVGARHLIGEHPEALHEVAMDDEAVLVDVDTPEALIALDSGGRR
ncbi:MAG: molybdopterin-binding/glycosyltransferase family 2 protein [Alphaproteobacteria bacterium]